MAKKKVCPARGCGKKFVPVHLFNQDYCCNACRQRAFYDQFVEKHGMSPAWFRKKEREKLKARKKKRKGVKV